MTTGWELPGVTNMPTAMTHEERARIRLAAFKVIKLYPGPVGELLSRELLTWEEFGYRLGNGRLIQRLVEHVFELMQEPKT